MALPEGVTTATVTAGVPVSHTGAPVKAFLSIEPSAFLVHTATGTPLVDFLEELSINEGVAGQFTLPHTDQTGFQDENGNAYTNWYYTARLTYSTPSKAKTKAPRTKVFQLPTGQTTVDLDSLPGGAPALPYIAPTATVTSVNGRTGPVTIVDGDLPARLSEGELSATYEPKGEAASQLAAAKGTTLAPMAAVDHPSGIVLKSAYDPRTRSYNLNQATLSKARAAHARGLTGGKPMQIHFLGHSYLTGFQSAAPYPTNTSPAQVTRALDASGRVGKVAEGHRVFTYGSTLGARLSDDTRFTIPAEWTYISGHGYALASVYRNIANTGDLTFAPGVPITHFEVVYLASTVTGAWTFSTNGGAGFAGTGITATNPTIAYFSRIISVSADPAIASLIIRPPATGHVMIQSIRAYTETATIKNAIEVTNAGQSGSTAAGTTVGSWTHSLAGYASTAQAIAFYKPDLACIMLGTNDRNAGRTETEYINAMRTLAQQVQTAGGDVIFLREPTPTEQGFTDGLYGLADEIGAGLIEVGPDWPSTYANAKAEPYGYIGVDNGHPSPRGHTAIARAVSSALISAL